MVILVISSILQRGTKKITFYSARISKVVYFGNNIVKKYQKKYRYWHIDTFSDTVSVSVLIHFVKKYLYRHIDTFQKYRLKVCKLYALLMNNQLM